MTNDKSDSGKPTCCGPGDLSACVIETNEARSKSDSEAIPKKNTVKDEKKKDGKA